MAKMGKIFRQNFGSTRIANSNPKDPSRITAKEYRILHLEAMAREEKKFNETFSTNDTKYQNLYRKALRRK